jgi:hypothetical protein
VLLFGSELCRGYAEVFLHVSAEERGIGEPELIADLLDAIIGLLQIIADVLEHMFRNLFIGCLTGI